MRVEHLELTKKIKENFKLSPEEIIADPDMEIGKITTSSIKALKYYNEGKRLYYRRKYKKSIEELKKALEGLTRIKV